MQTQVMFYLLNENSNDDAEPNNGSASYQACLQASHFYRQNQKVFIYTQDQDQAHSVDELLWAFEPQSFVPHNLQGEGASYGSAVEISWQAPTGRRPVLINLTNTVPSFANKFSLIVDFVPTDEILKQQARERFRTCRQLNFQVSSQAVVESSAQNEIVK
jgi:DNA polymerase-3 subunit chi